MPATPRPGAAGGQGTISFLTPDAPGFSAGCEGVGALLARRETESAFNPAIARHAPAPAELAADPQGLLAADAAVVLTTWADELRQPLLASGFTEEPVPWPAGPANTSIFRRTGKGPLTYLEVVNDADPRIAPAHLAVMTESNGLLGGAISAITGDAAWLAVMAVVPGAAAGTGTRLWQALTADLAQRGLRRIDLGTQTAESFYRRQGLATTSRVVRHLRARTGPRGPVWCDLVMMTGALDDADRIRT